MADLNVVLGGFFQRTRQPRPKTFAFDLACEIGPSILRTIKPIWERLKCVSNDTTYFRTRQNDGLTVCGAAGLPTENTDQNILSALCLSPGLLPKKLWASIVVRGRDQYHAFYHRPVVTADDYPITHVDYSVLHDGGEFCLLPSIVFLCLLLGKAVYSKMVSMMAVVVHNKVWHLSGLGPVAARAV